MNCEIPKRFSLITVAIQDALLTMNAASNDSIDITFTAYVLFSAVQVPTFSPDAKARQMNAVASFLGDERAAKARAKWGRPLKAVLITGGGVMPA